MPVRVCPCCKVAFHPPSYSPLSKFNRNNARKPETSFHDRGRNDVSPACPCWGSSVHPLWDDWENQASLGMICAFWNKKEMIGLLEDVGVCVGGAIANEARKPTTDDRQRRYKWRASLLFKMSFDYLTWRFNCFVCASALRRSRAAHKIFFEKADDTYHAGRFVAGEKMRHGIKISLSYYPLCAGRRHETLH